MDDVDEEEEEGDGDDDGKDHVNGEDSEDDGDVETEEKLGEDWTLALEVPQSWAMKKPIIEMVMIMTDMINR